MTRRCLFALLMLAALMPVAEAAPKPKYLIWRYEDSPEYTYILRNYSKHPKRDYYLAEYTCRDELTGAVLGQEAFYPDGFYFWEPDQWPDGAWENSGEALFWLTTDPGNHGGGYVESTTDVLPEWAAGLPDFYDWD